MGTRGRHPFVIAAQSGDALVLSECLRTLQHEGTLEDAYSTHGAKQLRVLFDKASAAACCRRVCALLCVCERVVLLLLSFLSVLTGRFRLKLSSFLLPTTHFVSTRSWRSLTSSSPP